MISQLIRGEQRGRQWLFWFDELLHESSSPLGDPFHQDAAVTFVETLAPKDFENLARKVMSEYFDTVLVSGSAPGVRKEWDMISPNCGIIGDAKYFTMVHGKRLPPAKFSIIAEHVWLLEKTGAATTFLVFGNDMQVPKQWLRRHGHLVSITSFYFLTDEGMLECLLESTL